MNNHLNKTSLTKDVTRAAIRWLHEAGFKPVETEVSIADGWIADVAGMCVATPTEAIGLKLIGRKPKWNVANSDAHVRWKRTFEALPDPLTGIVEVKTTKADFTNDRKWNLPRPANLCWLAMPKGLINSLCWPAYWGVLEFSEEKGLRVAKPAELHVLPIESNCNFVVQVAMRRDNATRPNRMKEFNELDRSQQAERVTRTRFSCAISLVKGLAAGKYRTVKEALEDHYVRCSLSHRMYEELESLIPVSKSPEICATMSPPIVVPARVKIPRATNDPSD